VALAICYQKGGREECAPSSAPVGGSTLLHARLFFHNGRSPPPPHIFLVFKGFRSKSVLHYEVTCAGTKSHTFLPSLTFNVLLGHSYDVFLIFWFILLNLLNIVLLSLNSLRWKNALFLLEVTLENIEIKFKKNKNIKDWAEKIR
jgi:hypothetical protein